MLNFNLIFKVYRILFIKNNMFGIRIAINKISEIILETINEREMICFLKCLKL
jgi:hypothetical protein